MALKITDPGELIATIPLLLGFAPVDSVVVVGLTSQGAICPVLRADVADFAIADATHTVSQTIATHLVRFNAHQAIVIGFGHRGDIIMPDATVSARRALAVRGIEVRDAWVVANGRYRSPECVDPRCCPDTGRLLPPAPAAVGRAFASRPHGQPGVAQGPLERRRKAQRACDRSWASRVQDPVQWRGQRLAAWRSTLAEAVQGRLPTDAQTGKLVAGLRDVAVRDAIVVDLVPGEDRVAESLCVDPAAPGVREALSAMLVASSAIAPQAHMLDALEKVVDRIAWLCPSDSAPAMTILGLMRWWHGDESGATHAIAVALTATPGYRLAELIQCAIDAHLPPGWLTAA